MTATCARFAASATRVKSFSRASVEGAGAGTGIFETVGDCWMEEEAAELGLDGDEMGASIVTTGLLCG